MIKSEQELSTIIKEFPKKIPETSLLLFRGQTNKYDKIRSGRARPDAFIIPEIENGWNTIVNRISTNTSNNKKYNQAILQHYGFPTFYLDLTSNPLTAAWFACNEFTPLKPTMWIGNTFRYHDDTTYTQIEEGIGYVYILEIPNYYTMIQDDELFDITKETRFDRPQKQGAYLMLDQPPRLPNPNDFVKEIIEIDRKQFRSSKGIKELFPHPNSDKGYADLLDVPFVQFPSFYMNDKKEEKETEIDLDKYFVVGRRAIKIPFYVEDKDDLFEFNPKWKDTTIFEPSPFRLWKTEQFNLEEIHEGQKSIFGETTKITLSPLALHKLLTEGKEIELEWPRVNSNSIFFTKSVLDHDKVINHTPPYFGIWLHRDNDLILEMHLVSDEKDEMFIQLGHAYTLNAGKLEYVKIKNECDCGKPEDHFELIESLLKIHGLIEKEEVALVQHAFFIDKWYVLI